MTVVCRAEKAGRRGPRGAGGWLDVRSVLLLLLLAKKKYIVGFREEDVLYHKSYGGRGCFPTVVEMACAFRVSYSARGS